MAQQGLSFRFLFRQDQGVVSRQIWWAGTLGITLFQFILTDVLWLLSGGAYRTLENTPFFNIFTLFFFVYLMLYMFAILVSLVSQYFISAKRFRDRGLPSECAGLLPLSFLISGAVNWIVPRFPDLFANWISMAFDIGTFAILVWNIWELGIRRSA